MKKSTDSTNISSSGSSVYTNYREEWEKRRKLEKEKEIEEQKRILREMEEEKKRQITEFLEKNSPAAIAGKLNEYIISQPSLTRETASFFIITVFVV